MLFLFATNVPAQTDCATKAQQRPQEFSAETRRELEAKLNEARERYEKEPKSVEALIWYGRRTAYLAHYKDAIFTFTEGIEQFPNDAQLYRHRGHRYITLRCFDAAIADLEKAAKLIKGKPDEIEPHGFTERA